MKRKRLLDYTNEILPGEIKELKERVIKPREYKMIKRDLETIEEREGEEEQKVCWREL
jgi:hypothetical protein